VRRAYGIPACCAACKSFINRFFHRMDDLPPCSENGQCAIDPSTRSQCGACRMAKCRAAGLCGMLFRVFVCKSETCVLQCQTLLPKSERRKHWRILRKSFFKIILRILMCLCRKRHKLSASVLIELRGISGLGGLSL
jgi:hypothetical protein